MTKYYLIQFSSDSKRMRLVNKALFDGYTIGDRFLEGVMFEIRVDADGALSVEADEDAKDYLMNVKSSPSKWSKTIQDFIENNKGYDALVGDSDDEDWSDDELHLTDDLSFYTNDYVLEA